MRFLAIFCWDNTDDDDNVNGSYVELYCGSCWVEYIIFDIGVDDNSDEPFVICDACEEIVEDGNDLNWLNFWLLISFNKCSFVVTNDLYYSN